eukprot:6213638-Pleurochrysis_carterae.AAC.1
MLSRQDATLAIRAEAIIVYLTETLLTQSSCGIWGTSGASWKACTVRAVSTSQHSVSGENARRYGHSSALRSKHATRGDVNAHLLIF